MLSFFILCKIMNVKSYTNYRVGERFWKNFSFKFYAVLAACAFHYDPAPAARLFGGFASSCKAKGAFTSEAPSHSQSERAACAFHYDPAPAARTVGHFTPSLEAKGASSSGVPMPSCSKRAACAFLLQK